VQIHKEKDNKKFMVQENTEQHQTILKSATDLPDDKQLYFNGFVFGVGNGGDVILVLTRNGKPNVLLQTNIMIARNLANKLSEIMDGLEKDMGQRILTNEQFSMMLKNKETEQSVDL
jgi:hypothetical protein